MLTFKIGWVRGIAWSDRAKLPDFLLIEFDNYCGPAFIESHVKYIPVPPFVGEFLHDGMACKRVQFPIVLAWAITIHKCQGMTLPRAVIDIGKKEMQNGLTFVAISRVRRIEDLAFSVTYPLSRLQGIKNGKNMDQRLAEEARLDSIEIA
jgi:ATP-dependent DNA helicase PIF1